MKNKIFFVILFLVFFLKASSQDSIIKSLVFIPDSYYYGIEATNSIRVIGTNGIVEADKEFTIRYYVNGKNITDDLIDSYSYSISTETSGFLTRSSNIFPYSEFDIKSYNYTNGTLILTCIIKKGTAIKQLVNALPLFALIAKKDNQIITSDYAVLSIEYINKNESEIVSTPSINFVDGKIHFTCDTEGAIVNSDISSSDINHYSSNEINLSGIYNITAYASKLGYYDSEKLIATLVWSNPQLKNTTNKVNEINNNNKPLLITYNSGKITINGIEQNDIITVCSINGNIIKTIKAIDTTASIDLSNIIGQIVIINIKGNSFKILVK